MGQGSKQSFATAELLHWGSQARKDQQMRKKTLNISKHPVPEAALPVQLHSVSTCFMLLCYVCECGLEWPLPPLAEDE